MSGPKVVTIVTREEILDTCLTLIAALASAVERWETAANRSGAVSDDEIAAARQRVTEMRTLLENDRFVDIQKQVPMSITFLDSDIETMAQKSANIAAAARARTRRSIAAARTMRSELAARGLVVPLALSLPEDHSEHEIEKALAQAFASLAPASAPETMSDRQRELAAFHAANEGRQTFGEWMASLWVSNVDPLLVSLEAKLDELRVLDPRQFETLSLKLPEIAAEKVLSRQALLADSLTLDIAAARKSASEKLRTRSTLEALRAEAVTLSYGQSADLASEIGAALADEDSDTASLAAATSAFEQALLLLRDEKASLQRRKALLEGLGELGYAVREGMETAWVENGRVVLRGGTKPGYGVEIGGNADVALQVRTVAFDPLEARSAQSDIAAEESFCGDFSALQEHLKARGGNLKLVRAMGVGRTRVKQVEALDVEAEYRASEVDVSRRGPLSSSR